ncbi:hypothetical protein Lxx02260 [Leifsonia xyli subsp. xyli str. CTCB07]|uniref:Uncharacterized protein n=1 Tax=Leifsonia xyli subsp. xyli (strain CTCB07) TaxID=281090 RepID=Q6AH67_LEIXX|nr:hypothetical protein Lxx02260 [Leifsonia xyli subsp. xyli str. CTCB07]
MLSLLELLAQRGVAVLTLAD